MIVADPSRHDTVIELIRETANGLGELAGLHLKMARRELAGELQTLRRLVLMAGIVAAFLFVGYLLAAAGVGMLIAGRTSLGRPFVALGGGHLLLATAAAAWLRRRRARPPLLEVMANEAEKSVMALAHGHQ